MLNQHRKLCLSPQYRIYMRELYATCCISLILMFTSCSTPFSPVPPIPTSTSEPVSTATLFPPGPSPAPSLLDLPPQHCPPGPPISYKVFPKGWGGYQIDQTLTGSSPVWEDYIAPNRPLHLEIGGGYTPWPAMKILWEVGPNYTQSVTVQVTNLQTGELAWWGTGLGAPRKLVLDQSGLEPGDHGHPEPGWHEWGSGVYILQAGCYAMDVSWPSSDGWSAGHWRIIFAAGR
jgi:hypothetical protein